jgi:hypothetical protein
VGRGGSEGKVDARRLVQIVIAAWYSAAAVMDELAPAGNGPAPAEKQAIVEPAARPMTAVLQRAPKLRVTCECTSQSGSEYGSNVGTLAGSRFLSHPLCEC